MENKVITSVGWYLSSIIKSMNLKQKLKQKKKPLL